MTSKQRSFSVHPSPLAVAILLAAIALLALMAGCLPWATPTPVPQTERAAPTPSPERLTPTPIALTPEPISSAITLTLWTSEAFSPADEASGHILQEQYDAFMAANPDIVIEYELKKPYDKGGILDFLLTTSAVVPKLLPDLVAIDTSELGEAARAGILQPLDELISSKLGDDLFPFAREACLLDGKLMGIQFEADIQHLVYNTAIVEEPPHTWAELLAGGASYVFPAGDGEAASDAFLIQYLALGGRLVDEAGNPALDREKLTQVLEFYREGSDKGIIPRSVLDLKTLDDCWPLYLSAEAAMANISSRRYSASRGSLGNTAFAPIPTRDGNASTISHGWALAIVTRNPRRQAAAARFIEWLLDPKNTAAWNQGANHLPTRRSAFALQVADNYTAFLREQLEGAHFRPSPLAYSEALQRAIQDVLTGNATPKEAAAEVIAEIK